MNRAVVFLVFLILLQLPIFLYMFAQEQEDHGTIQQDPDDHNLGKPEWQSSNSSGPVIEHNEHGGSWLDSFNGESGIDNKSDSIDVSLGAARFSAVNNSFSLTTTSDFDAGQKNNVSSRSDTTSIPSNEIQMTPIIILTEGFDGPDELELINYNSTWSTNAPVAGWTHIDQNEKYGGNGSLRIKTKTAGSGESYYPWAKLNINYTKIEFYMKFKNNGVGTAHYSFIQTSKGQTEYTTFYYGTRSNNMRYYNGQTLIDTSLNVNSNQWYKYTMTFDYENRKFSGWIHGGSYNNYLVANNCNFYSLATNNWDGNFFLKSGTAWTNVNSTTWFDNLTLYGYPEEASWESNEIDLPLGMRLAELDLKYYNVTEISSLSKVQVLVNGVVKAEYDSAITSGTSTKLTASDLTTGSFADVVDDFTVKILLASNQARTASVTEISGQFETVYGEIISEPITIDAGANWDTIIVDRLVPTGGLIQFSILDNLSQPIPGFTNMSFDGEVDISALDAGLYPTIRLKAYFEYREPPTPPARNAAVMSTIRGTDKVVLWGGLGANGFLNDTWIFDVSDNVWEKQEPVTSPNGTNRLAMSSPYNNDKAVLFGSFGDKFAETWVYDESDESWVKRTHSTKPSTRHDHAMAGSGADDKIVMFAGTNSNQFLGDTWVYDHSDDKWTQQNPSSRPVNMDSQAMCGVYGKNEVLLFAGYTWSKSYNDVWIYNFTSNTWTKTTQSLKPTAAGDAMIAPIYGTDKFLAFAGEDASFTPIGDSWLYDYGDNKWTKLNTGTSPSARLEHTMASVYGTDKVVMFGGWRRDGTIFGDTWIYDQGENSWNELKYSNETKLNYWGVSWNARNAWRDTLYGGAKVHDSAATDVTDGQAGYKLGANISYLTSSEINVPTGYHADTLIFNTSSVNGTYINITLLDASSNAAVVAYYAFSSSIIDLISIAGLPQDLMLRATFHSSVNESPVLYDWSVNWSANETVQKKGGCVDIDPNTLNLKSQGNWITVYIEPKDGRDPENINVSTVIIYNASRANETIYAELHPTTVGDHDNDSLPDRMVKFDRSAVQAIVGVCQNVTLWVEGYYEDGTHFKCSDAIRVINPPDDPHNNGNGKDKNKKKS